MKFAFNLRVVVQCGNYKVFFPTVFFQLFIIFFSLGLADVVVCSNEDVACVAY